MNNFNPMDNFDPMESTRCSCKSCGEPFGDFFNLWVQVQDVGLGMPLFYGPCISGLGPRGVPRHEVQELGDVRVAAGILDGCQAKEVGCLSCHKGFGLICLATPTNHVFDRGQLLFKATHIITAPANLRFRWNHLRIVRVLPFTDPPFEAPSIRDEMTSLIKSEVQSVRGEIHGPNGIIKAIERQTLCLDNVLAEMRSDRFAEAQKQQVHVKAFTKHFIKAKQDSK